MMLPDWTDLKAIVIDVNGLELTAAERDLLTSEKPAGFILFERNCKTPQQVKDLVTSVRECVGRDDLPVLIDQEGGTVARLKSPAFTEYPSARHFQDMATCDGIDVGVRAVEESFFNMAQDLLALGITVNCAPVMDLPSKTCHPFLSDYRTYGTTVEEVTRMGAAVCRGLLAGGILPVIKHIPGHGRATADSHFDLPIVSESYDKLSKTDFMPFKSLSFSDMKTNLWAMAAHVVYSDIDSDSAASMSSKITNEVIREYMGFEGVLIADDISMKALGGTVEERVTGTMAAGMDLTMLCNASFEDRVQALAATPKVTQETAGRIWTAEVQRLKGYKKNERRSANS